LRIEERQGQEARQMNRKVENLKNKNNSRRQNQKKLQDLQNQIKKNKK